MDPFQTPGAFSWCELMTSDPAAATGFYKTLFGWTIEPMKMGMPYNVLKVGESAIGGIMGMPPGAPSSMPPMWAAYVTVTDVDALVGKVMMPPADIPNVGRFAVFQDPQGAMLNVIAYAMPAG